MESKFGNTLRRLRAEKKLTQVQLAEELGISLSCLAMYESGQREANRINREKLCDYFGVDLNYLYGKSEIRNSYHKREHVVQVPLYSQLATDHEPFADKNIIESVILPDLILDHNNFYFALQMEDAALSGSGIRENDILIFQKKDEIEPNEIGCFKVGDKIYVRKYYTEKNKKILGSTCDDYKNIDVSKKECTCLGKLAIKISKV